MVDMTQKLSIKAQGQLVAHRYNARAVVVKTFANRVRVPLVDAVIRGDGVCYHTQERARCGRLSHEVLEGATE